MRKILSKKQEEKRARKNQLIIGGLMILIMIASIVGYSFGREQQASNEEITYNGFVFTKESGLWYASIEKYQLSFKYNPKETGEINSKLNLLNSYIDKPLYIYSENSEATTEIYRNMFYQNQIVERVQNACVAGYKCDNNSPVKTCENNFIIIKESNTTSIRQEDNCVFIEGEYQNLTKISDIFLFKIIEVQ